MMKKIKASRSTNGFTLIEMLMVVFLFALIMTLSGALFSAVLKGSSKSEINKDVKQAGDYAMSQMERNIRNAKTVKCRTDINAATIEVTDRDNILTTYNCLFHAVDGVNVAYIASNSAQLTGDNVTLSNTACPGDLNFTCNMTVTPPQVTISFTLFQKGTSTKPEDQASVKFQSTVNLRTY